MKHPVRYRLEYYLVRLLWAIFAALPLSAASGLGAVVGSALARVPPLRARVARNLARALPELSGQERAVINKGVWKNLGRTMAEQPHLKNFTVTESSPGAGQIQVIGGEYLQPDYDQGHAVILFSGHLANWELMPMVISRYGRPLHAIYRAPNNPLIDKWLYRLRDGVVVSALAKGRSAARGILSALKQGHSIAMLVDQKMNDGIPVDFFGQTAMTAPALAQLALRQNIKVLPVNCERIGGATFRITVLEPLTYSKTDNHQDDVAKLMAQVNDMLEGWIRARPEQWLWPHNRWPK